MAARSGQAEVVRYLVQDGAQVEAKAKVCAILEKCLKLRKNPLIFIKLLSIFMPSFKNTLKIVNNLQ